MNKSHNKQLLGGDDTSSNENTSRLCIDLSFTDVDDDKTKDLSEIRAGDGGVKPL